MSSNFFARKLAVPGCDGYCQAVLADLVKSWENGDDAAKLDVLTPAEKMPAAPVAAYELKGDKLGSSMAEYLHNHQGYCVSTFATPPEIHHSAFSGNTLQHSGNQHPNALRFSCQNIDTTYAQTVDLILLGRQLL